MSISANKLDEPLAIDVRVDAEKLSVELADGRTISVPISWYPRLLHATAAERRQWTLIGCGRGIHWPDLDEDISTEALLQGRGSLESEPALSRWLQARHRQES